MKLTKTLRVLLKSFPLLAIAGILLFPTDVAHGQQTDSNSVATGSPTIAGTAQVGETLTASITGIADTDGLENVAYSYQWLADDTETDGATSSTYTLQAPVANNAASGQPTSARFTGTATVGNTLTAATSGITDADGLDDAEFSYQWLRADAAISGATSSTYTLIKALRPGQRHQGARFLHRRRGQQRDRDQLRHRVNNQSPTNQ